MSNLLSSSLCCWYFCHLLSSLLLCPPLFFLCPLFHLLSPSLFRWVRQQGSKSPRQSSALVSLFRKHWVMLMQAQPMALNLFTHVIKLYNVVIVDIHGVEVYFCSHQCSFPAVLPPSQWCDRHEGLGGCSQQSQQNHCECHRRTS